MNAPAIKDRIEKGFSLVELMVAMVISLLTIIAIFDVFATFEGQKRTTTSTMDAQESGLMALHAIERDARMAGHGMIVNDAIACPTLTMYTGGAPATIPFLPISITDGAAGGSDNVTIMYSTSAFAPTPSPLTLDLSTSEEDPVVNNTSNNAVFQVGNYILVAQPSLGKTCVRLRVTGTVLVGSDVKIQHASAEPANPPPATNIFPATGYTADSAEPSVVINMGAMVRSTYSVLNGNLVFTDNNIEGASIPLAAGIVNIQAQYGIAAAGTPKVVNWVNATGPWAAPGPALIPQIKAIRLAVVVRSPIAEKENVTNVCVNNSNVNNFGPCAWSDTAAFPAPLIDFRADPDWQRYRYRVYETIIPLRNVIWGNI